jgi:glycosyltransferase involved in cell wall biosynthesis
MAVDLSVVVCARNEAAHVGEVLRRLASTFPDAELILVDNGSTDGTAQAAAAATPRVTIVVEPTPGKGTAMRTGARHAQGTWLLFHDADLEYDVEDSARVVATAMRENSSCIGARMVAYDQVLPSSWLANRLIQRVLRLRTGAHVADVLTGTRCMPTTLFRALNTQSPHFGIETEITRATLALGVPMLAEPVRFYPRTAADGKKIRVWDLFALLAQAFKR